MDFRGSLGTAHQRSRARVPQRAVTGGPHAFPQPPGQQPTLPRNLSAIRSTSQPVRLVDTTDSDTEKGKRNLLPFLQNNELVTSPADVEEDLEPPSKRVKTEGDDFRSEDKGSEDEKGDVDFQDEVHRIRPGSPLPAPPAVPSVTGGLAAYRRHRLGIEPAARKAHGLDPPTAAVRLPPPKKAADFSPWTNSHPEDILNENVVKTGYFDKTQGANQAECNSAKATISTSLNQKNNPGLSLLGYLFTSALEKRQASGKLTAPSTFKPPPRVTVTDAKREAWLKDLANPEVPLRKQSRTIPHGIRGKLLMEQCLAKSIPLPRAVWLAKCVGANELRAFRRKGVSGSTAASGEAKWVSEWTTHVQQFLEDVVAACGQENWQRKMNYAIKLGFAFYSEKLLDKDHFLDWIVASLTDTDRARLPIWLVLAQLYWKDLTLYPRRGGKLAEAILHHLDSLAKANENGNATLKKRLQQLVLAMATSSRACLIIPRRWEEYKHLFALEGLDTASTTAFENVIRRNESIVQPKDSPKNTRSPMLQLYSVLDSITLEIDIANLTERGLAFISDTNSLVQALFDWASTPYRTTFSRIYLTARIIAQLHSTGIDTDSSILEYLESTKDISASGVDHVHRVVVELVHLQAFSIGRYMRWLITGGMMIARDGPTCATGLVAALPSVDMPLHVLNTRKTLLKRIGHSPDETSVVQEVVEKLDAASSTGAEQTSSIEIPQGVSLSEKFEICRQICHWIGVKAKEDRITVEDVCMVRNLVEQVGDLHSLAALVHAAMIVDNSAILATLCDTINLHADSFAAAGELITLMDNLMDRYVAIRSSQPLERTFILAFQNVAERLPDRISLVKLLKDDLLICEQQNSLAVCSPASDSLIGMHASTLDSDEDLDAVFASGNTMDEQLMQRVLNRVLQWPSKRSSSGAGAASHVCGWLNQLRSVDSAGVFENLVQRNILSLLNSDVDYAFWMNGVVHLVASGCLALSDIADAVAGGVKSSETAVHLLPLFLSEDTAGEGLHEVEKYRFRLQQDRCRDLKAERILGLVRTACQSSVFPADDSSVLAFVVRAMTRESLTDMSAEFGTDDKSRENLERMLTTILTNEPSHERLSTRDIVSRSTPLSIQFCIALLHCNKGPLIGNESNEGDMGDALLEAFNNQSEVWPQLLESAGGNVNTKVRTWARDQVLLMASSTPSETDATAVDEAGRFLNLLAVSSNLAPEADDTATVLTVTEKLRDLESKFNELNDLDIQPAQQTTSEVLSRLHIHLHILLQLVKLHLHPSRPTLQESRIPLLATLCTLLTSRALQLSSDLLDQLSDLASTLASSLSSAALSATKTHLPASTLSNPRIKLLLGSISDSSTDSSWLTLVSHAQPAGTSQQQRLLNRNLASQNSPSSRGLVQHQRGLSNGSPGMVRQDSRMGGLAGGGGGGEVKMTPFVVRQWEVISDAAPIMGENDASLSLRLFGARKV